MRGRRCAMALNNDPRYDKGVKKLFGAYTEEDADGERTLYMDALESLLQDFEICPQLCERAEVADVQDDEQAVGQCDRAAGAPLRVELRAKLVQRADLVGGDHGARSSCTASSSSSGATVAVQAFITTRPAA